MTHEQNPQAPNIFDNFFLQKADMNWLFVVPEVSRMDFWPTEFGIWSCYFDLSRLQQAC